VERPVPGAVDEEDMAPGAVRDFLVWEEEWLAAEDSVSGAVANAPAALALGLRRLATALEGMAANGGSARVAYRGPVEQVRQAARAIEERRGAADIAGPVKSACTAAAGLVGDLTDVNGGDPEAAEDLRDTAEALPAAGPLASSDARVAACLARAAEALEGLTAR
jgi:hypothetical protein